jgi:hypothetical protein
MGVRMWIVVAACLAACGKKSAGRCDAAYAHVESLPGYLNAIGGAEYAKETRGVLDKVCPELTDEDVKCLLDVKSLDEVASKCPGVKPKTARAIDEAERARRTK